MAHVTPSYSQHYELYLRDSEENILVEAALLNSLSRATVLELILEKSFTVQKQVNELNKDRALVG